MTSFLTSFLKNDTDTPCKLLLYYADKRVSDSKWSKSLELQTSQPSHVNDVVCTYFQIYKDWDQKLIDSFLFEDLSVFQCFEISPRENENVNYGMYIVGNPNILLSEATKNKYRPLFKNQRLSFFVKNANGTSNCELNLQELTKRKVSNSVIALFNSESFRGFTECNRSKTFLRAASIIDLPLQAKI